MNGNLKKLIKIIKKHPELPVILFDTGDDYVADSGVAIIGDCRVDKYIKRNLDFHIYDRNNLWSALSGVLDFNKFVSMSDDEKIEEYEKLPWKEGIIVNMITPDEI